MASWADVARLALALPEVAESTTYGHGSWAVRGKSFVWERPLGKKDRQALGASAPGGPILGAAVGDLAEKEAVLAAHADAVFTTPHFDGYPAVLIRLDVIDAARLEELVVDAWLAKAPVRLAEEFLEARAHD